MNTVIFFICAFITAAVLFMTNRIAGGHGMSGRLKRMIPLILSVVLVLISMLAYFKVVDPGHYQEAYTFMSLVSAVSCFVSYLDTERFRKEQKFFIKALTVTALLELTLFNLPSYYAITGNYPVKEIPCSDIKTESGGELTDGAIYLQCGEEFKGEIENINIPVSSVYVDLRYTDPRIQTVRFCIDAKDSTRSAEYRNDVARNEAVRNIENSKYIRCDLSGKVSDIRLRMSPSEGENICFTKIIINKPVPFSIQYIRFVLLLILSVFIYSTVSGGVLSESFDSQSNLCSKAAFIMTVLFLTAAFIIVDYRMTEGTWYGCFHAEHGNQVTEELVEAFKKGHVYLDRETEDFLYEIENPYDDTQRNEAGGQGYAWDHVFYKNHYYSYYGIAPVLLLFLPYNLITGYYCSNEFAILVFGFTAICGITLMYLSFIRKWFSGISSGIVIACLFIIQLSSGIWYSLGRTDFYEISLAAGLAFMSWAVFFFIESGVPEGKISLLKTALSSLFFSLAVLSRPTLAVYCICAALFLMSAARRVSEPHRADKLHGYLSRESVKYLLCAMGPMVILGLMQMIYNYLRFESPFDFGIQYSLTINDFTNSEFHIKFCAVALYNYLFNPPVFQMEYPFVRTDFQYMHSSGYFYADTFNTLNTSGLFTLVPLTWFYLASRRAMRQFGTRKQKIKTLLKIAVPCLAAPLIIIMSVWESGYAVRYTGDFSVEIILGAFVMMFLILKSTSNGTIKKLITYMVCFSLVWVIYAEGIQIVNQAFRYYGGVYTFPEIAYSVKSIVSFWY